MIHFNLACTHDHEFEAWFQDGDAFARQARRRQIECPRCGDTDIRKAPMAPAIGRADRGPPPAPDGATEAAKMHRALTSLRDHVEKSCEDVGERFAEEARRIHYGETEERGIYGQSTDDEARELKREGVPFARLPWPRRTDS